MRSDLSAEPRSLISETVARTVHPERYGLVCPTLMTINAISEASSETA